MSSRPLTAACCSISGTRQYSEFLFPCLAAWTLLHSLDCSVSSFHRLAEEHDFPQIEGLLTKYASRLVEEGRKMEAIELFRKAKRHPEAAKLLAEVAQDVVKMKAHPHRYVLIFWRVCVLSFLCAKMKTGCLAWLQKA